MHIDDCQYFTLVTARGRAGREAPGKLPRDLSWEWRFRIALPHQAGLVDHSRQAPALVGVLL